MSVSLIITVIIVIVIIIIIIIIIIISICFTSQLILKHLVFCITVFETNYLQFDWMQCWFNCSLMFVYKLIYNTYLDLDSLNAI